MKDAIQPNPFALDAHDASPEVLTYAFVLLCHLPDAQLPQERDHRAPVGETRLQEVQADEEREPKEVGMHVHSERHTCGYKGPGNGA
jgi:hypothetical protein